VPGYDEAPVALHMKGGEIRMAVDIGIGSGRAVASVVEQCFDDSEIQTCNLDRWSLRAWKFWLAPENRRWWWWAAEPADGEIRVRALVRAKPYLRGSLDWLWKASPPLGGGVRPQAGRG